jgi:hypothetical protein
MLNANTYFPRKQASKPKHFSTEVTIQKCYKTEVELNRVDLHKRLTY